MGMSIGPAPQPSHAHVSTRNEHHDDTATLKSVIIAVKSNGKRKIGDRPEGRTDADGRRRSDLGEILPYFSPSVVASIPLPAPKTRVEWNGGREKSARE